MKRKNLVKLTAIATAAAMAISPAMVFAADSDDDATEAGDEINGSGSLEDYISKDVFKVVLPALTDANFTLDPQGLLNVANSSTYTAGPGAIYFEHKPTTTGGNSTYSDTSDPIKIINKSSFKIDVDFSVEVTLPEGITMVESSAALANATTPSVYLEMKEAGDTNATVLKVGKNTAATKEVNGVPEDTTANVTKATATGYLITATDAGNGKYTYKYELGDAFVEANADNANYTLKGACDTTADWSALKDKNVTTKIIWSAKKHTDSYLSKTTMTPSSNSLEMSALPDRVTLSKAVITSEDGAEVYTLTNEYSVSGTTLSVSAASMNVWLGLEPAYTKLVLTFSDGKTETINLQR